MADRKVSLKHTGAVSKLLYPNSDQQLNIPYTCIKEKILSENLKYLGACVSSLRVFVRKLNPKAVSKTKLKYLGFVVKYVQKSCKSSKEIRPFKSNVRSTVS